ncbi:MAG: CHAT domain-containing protein, partial [bacterium]|nr:CHAT domain-containing protein [bacterium]
MPYSYHTYRIRIANRTHVRVEALDSRKDAVDEPQGRLSFDEKTQARLSELQRAAVENRLSGQEVEEFGELLFAVLFDDALRHDFFTRYRIARDEGALFRIALDVDERELPEIAALPWEFLRAPLESGYPPIWFATAPELVFSRRRALWTAAGPIRLDRRESLRIALVLANPKDLGPVEFQDLLAQLNILARSERIESIDPVVSADKRGIDAVLERERPHIFHFIGHAKFSEGVEQLALVGGDGNMTLIGADEFSELFSRHQPGIVVLQACESGKLSGSQSFRGIASRIVQQNVPVLVAMQYQVSNSTATQFALEFYRRLAENDPVDKAVQEGRRRIAISRTG